jgi:hypothetical protein
MGTQRIPAKMHATLWYTSQTHTDGGISIAALTQAVTNPRAAALTTSLKERGHGSQYGMERKGKTWMVFCEPRVLGLGKKDTMRS